MSPHIRSRGSRVRELASRPIAVDDTLAPNQWRHEAIACMRDLDTDIASRDRRIAEIERDGYKDPDDQ